MITRVQGKTLAGEIAVRKEPRLSALEKSMLRWVVVDPEDRLLDANVGSGMMAEYLRRNMQCEVCGVSDHMDQVRMARDRLQSCDIVYAPVGDIPWREDAFDTVLMKMDAEEMDTAERMIAEAKRVLKPGGQLILGVLCFPAAFSAVSGLLVSEEKRPIRRQEVHGMLSRASYENITWQRTGLGMGVMIAWKGKPGIDEIRTKA